MARNKIFISYSHADAEWLARVLIHLSADFLSSDFIVNNELPGLLAAAERDGARILPLIVSPSYYFRTESLAQFQTVNDPAQPLIDLYKSDQERIFLKLVEEIDVVRMSDSVTQERNLSSRLDDVISHFPDIRLTNDGAVPFDPQKTVWRRKVCLLGAFAVGKTSLVARFVNSIYDEKYLTTVGMKIDSKLIRVDEHELTLLIWDAVGQTSSGRVVPSIYHGAGAIMFVADGTRLSTLDAVLDIYQSITESLGPIPSVLALNKYDLVSDWEIDPAALTNLKEKGWRLFYTSAKTGENVENAFAALARLILYGDR